jgi:hypothetical protein
MKGLTVIHNIPPAHAAILDCQLCGQTGYGVVGASICLDCLGAASACHHCDSTVTTTIFSDGILQLDVSHAGDCPRRAA